MTRGYLLGRLLAALEHLGTAERHRLYVQASVAPAALVPALARATESGEAAAELLTPIVAQLAPDAFAGQLGDEEGSDFALGYYHQRAQFRTGALPLDGEEPDLSDRWEIRIEPDLKQWALENGGSRLVRTLLREARASQTNSD